MKKFVLSISFLLLFHTCFAQMKTEKINMGGPTPQESAQNSAVFFGVITFVLFGLTALVIPVPKAEIKISNINLSSDIDKISSKIPMSFSFDDSLVIGTFERTDDNCIYVKQLDSTEYQIEKSKVENIIDLKSAAKQKFMTHVKLSVFLFGTSFTSAILAGGFSNFGSQIYFLSASVAYIATAIYLLISKSEEEEQWDLINPNLNEDNKESSNNIQFGFGFLKLGEIRNNNRNCYTELAPCLTFKMCLDF